MEHALREQLLLQTTPLRAHSKGVIKHRMSCFYFFIFLPPAGLPIKTKEDKRSRLDDVGNLRGITGVAAVIVEQPSPLLKIYPMEVHRKGNALECIKTVCVKHVGWPSIRLCEQTSCLPPIILLFLT